MRAMRVRVRTRGQALTELAVAAPLLVLLLVGGAQVGAIVYAQVTVDTAAREGARVASEQPFHSGAYLSDGTPASPAVTCSPALTPNNPACKAVWSSSGMLSSTSLQVSVGSGTFISSSAASCPPNTVGDGYVLVTVAYDAPVFVPLVDRFFSTGTGVHTVSTTVRERVEPCTLTSGQ